MCVCLFDFDFPGKYKHKVIYLFKKYKLLTLANAAYNALFSRLVFHHFVHYILTVLNSCSYWNMPCILFPPALFPHNLLYLKHSLLLVCQAASQSSLEFQLTISSRKLALMSSLCSPRDIQTIGSQICMDFEFLLGQGLANFFCTGPDNKCNRVYGPDSLMSQVLSFAVVMWKQQFTICKQWVWLCSNKTLFTKTTG